VRWLRRGLVQLWGTVGDRRARERDLADELESHLQLDVDERVRHGADPAEARRQALLALGGVEATKERVRDQRRWRGLEELVQDVRFAVRSFGRERLFFAVVVLSFALAIGANTAIFGAVEAVLLRPLPFPDGDRLVMLWATDRLAGDHTTPVTPADFADWRAATRSYSAIAASRDSILTLTGEGEPESLISYQLAPEMFPLLGIAPALGHVFEPADGPRVVVLGDGLWRRRFHADPAVVGRAIQLDHEPYRVVGVMPPGFNHPRRAELWTPLVIAPAEATSRQRAMLRVLGRLRPGVSIEAARAELRAIGASLATEHPDSNRGRGAEVVSLRSNYTGDARPVLLVLLAAVGFVLLLTSSNIAGLSLARAARRGHELAVRTALGASRGRLVRQLLTESVLLAVIGGVAGMVLALWGAELLVQLFPRNVGNLKMPVIEQLPLDGRVVLFGGAVTLVAGIAAGLLPAIRGARADLGPLLKEGGRTSTRSSRLRPFLVAGQIGLALILTVGAGLTIRSARAHQRGLGFDRARLFTARVLLDRNRHPDAVRRGQFRAALLERLRATPGVRAAGLVSYLPLCGWSSATTFRLQALPGEEHEAGVLVAEPGYFTTLRIPIVRGRGFEAGDHEKAPPVILIDEGMARRFFGGSDPIGQRLDVGDPGAPDWRQIVGIAGDVENDPPPSPQRPMIYFPFTQLDWPALGVVVRGDGDPAALAPLVRDAVWSIDRDQPVSYPMTMDALVDDALAVARTSTVILSFFALVALVLAAMGIYGVLAHSVLERRREIGIRLALGAPPRHVLGLVLGRLLAMAGAGVVLGVVGALAGARVLAALVPNVPAHDPALLAGVVALIVAVALAAAWVPARRALQTDPMEALRAE
jgi:predicted permease